MPRLSVGLEPIQAARRNTLRHMVSVQLIPSSIITNNTGLVYGKFGSAPVADINSNSWDFVLNAGAADGANLYETTDEAFNKQDLWIIADTANQIINVVETMLPTPPQETAQKPTT